MPFGKTNVPGSSLFRMYSFVSLAAVCKNLSTALLDETIRSGEFLAWNAGANRYEVGEVQSAFLRLRSEIDLLRRQEELLGERAVFWKGEQQYATFKALQGNATPVPLDNSDLAAPCAVYDRHINIVALSRAVIRTLDGDGAALKAVKLASPFVFGGGASAESDVVESGIADVEGWLASH